MDCLQPACKKWVVGCWRGYLSRTSEMTSVCLWHLRQWKPTRSRHGWVHIVYHALPPTKSPPSPTSVKSRLVIGFTFLVPAHPGSSEKKPLKGCVCITTECRKYNVAEIYNNRLGIWDHRTVTSAQIYCHLNSGCFIFQFWKFAQHSISSSTVSIKALKLIVTHVQKI